MFSGFLVINQVALVVDRIYFSVVGCCVCSDFCLTTIRVLAKKMCQRGSL